MSRSKIQANQTILPGMEQALCACGCNTYFMRVSRGRKRLYLNDTHKKRVMRRKRTERQTDTRVMLTPKGIALAEKLSGRDYTKVWGALTLNEQWVLHLGTQHPEGLQAFWEAVSSLMRKETTLYLEAVSEELDAEYENG